MSTLSIRKLPKRLEQALLREAKAKQKTKTEIMISALENQLGVSRAKNRSEKLRKFFGKMSAQEYTAFKKSTADFSKIDEEIWQ